MLNSADKSSKRFNPHKISIFILKINFHWKIKIIFLEIIENFAKWGLTMKIIKAKS